MAKIIPFARPIADGRGPVVFDRDLNLRRPLSSDELRQMTDGNAYEVCPGLEELWDPFENE